MSKHHRALSSDAGRDYRATWRSGACIGWSDRAFCSSTEKTFHRGSTDYFVNARKGDIGAFDSPKFIGLPVGEVLNVAKDYLDVEATEPLANGDGLNVLIKREVVGFRANTVENRS